MSLVLTRGDEKTILIIPPSDKPTALEHVMGATRDSRTRNVWNVPDDVEVLRVEIAREKYPDLVPKPDAYVPRESRR